MNLTSLALDLVAITVLAYAIYFRRYRRREVMVATIGLNVAVVAVSYALSSASVGRHPGHQPVPLFYGAVRFCREGPDRLPGDLNQ